jgi:xylulokinase
MPVLGVDIGTQSLKAAILDDDLTILSAADRAYRPSYPRPGWAEQSPQLWLDALKPAIADALAAAGLHPGDIRAVSICGQLDGCVATDAHGAALAPAIIWMDRRATAEIVGVDPGLVRDRCGLVLDATHMAAKIAWLARHGDFAAPVVMWHQPVSFVAAALTGQHAMSHSLASTTMLYDIAARRWDAELLASFGTVEAMLPRLADEAEIIGTVSSKGAELTGLVAGTPVVAGTGDDFSNPLGCGVCAPGTVAVSLGTAETVCALADATIVDPDLLVETHAYPGGLYHIGNPGWLSGGAVRWASSLLSIASDGAFSDLAATAPAGCDGLTFIPALTGAMSPKWIDNARGSFIGLSTSHGPAHLARAVFEGTAFAMRDVVDRLTALGVGTSRLRLVGGGARSDPWCQIRADVTGRPADVLLAGDASAIGAGLLAAAGAGIAPDIRTAASWLRHKLREVLPDPAVAQRYDEAYRLYRIRFDALEPTWPASPAEA